MLKSVCVLWIFVCFVQAFTYPVDDYSVDVINSYNQPYDGVLSNGYKFGYELSDGQKRSEVGSFVKNSNNDDSLLVEGSYAYNDPEGDSFVISYVADERGYQPRVSRIGPSTVRLATGGSLDKYGAGQIDLRFGNNN